VIGLPELIGLTAAALIAIITPVCLLLFLPARALTDEFGAT
jgi:hypothetical protein